LAPSFCARHVDKRTADQNFSGGEVANLIYTAGDRAQGWRMATRSSRQQSKVLRPKVPPHQTHLPRMDVWRARLLQMWAGVQQERGDRVQAAQAAGGQRKRVLLAPGLLQCAGAY
jgi:hypothetical protein